MAGGNSVMLNELVVELDIIVSVVIAGVELYRLP